MRSTTPILAVLLVASLFGNAVLALRLARQSEPDPSAAARKTGASAEKTGKTDETAQLRASLDAERKKNEELKVRIERLETDKKVLAQDSPGAGAASKQDKLAAFKEKLRRLMKVMKDPAAKAGAVDPDDMVELTETMMEFFKLAAMRTKEPKLYSEYIQAFYEIGLEGEGTSLTADQSASLSRLFQEFGENLSRVPPAPAGERLLKEIELESGVMSRVKALLTPAQSALMSKENMDALAAGNMMSMNYVSGQGAADQIAQQWSSLYGLDAAQLPQATVAAQAYVDAMARYEAQNKGARALAMSRSGSPESYEHRIKSVREQLAALNLLSASMTPAQQEKLRTQTMRELLIMDGAAGIQVETVPADK